MATKLIQKSATSKAASSNQNSGACFQAETTAVWTETTAVEARSAKRRGASAGTRSPKRVQLEIFSQNESATDLDRIPSDRIKQEPLELPKAPRHWSGATGAWKRVESARAQGAATVIPDSGNGGPVSEIAEEQAESEWVDQLWMAAGIMSMAVMFFMGT